MSNEKRWIELTKDDQKRLIQLDLVEEIAEVDDRAALVFNSGDEQQYDQPYEEVKESIVGPVTR